MALEILPESHPHPIRTGHPAGVGEGTVARCFITGVLPVTMDDLTSGFNIGQIITLKEHTLEMMGFTQAETDAYLGDIFADHGYTDMFQRFLGDGDWATLFAGYWEQYVGQIAASLPTCRSARLACGSAPAQAFDKLNENFFRMTFYELGTRYLSRYLMFAIEVNHATGRSDWEAIGRSGTQFENRAELIEFKHVSVKEGKRLGVNRWSEPRAEDVEQVSRYAEDLQRRYPELTFRRHVAYTIGAKRFRFFSL